MRINFRQGIITYPISMGSQSFLVKTGSYVSLRAATSRVDVAFAHGDTDYLLTESTDINDAWGPIPASTDCWLYWDIDRQTGARTFGFTTVEPEFDSVIIPGVPDQHWFDTSTNKQKVYTDGVYREVIRVFAARVNNATFTPFAVGFPDKPYAGSQVAVYTPNVNVGRIIVDNAGNPIRRDNGEFFTTESEFFVDGSPINPVRLEATIVTGQALETMAKFQVVKFSAFGKLSLAGYNDTQTTMIAMLMEDLLWDEVGNVCIQGKITNPAWNWPTVGAQLWITAGGELSEIDPHAANAYVYPLGKPPVARVITPDTIIFDQGLGGKGDRGEPGLAGGVVLASTTAFGVARLSTTPADVDNPVVIGSNDPRLDNKVLKAGDVMTGPLILSANPVVNLGAATKQYVDSKTYSYALNDLTDVSTAGAVTDNTLVFNGSGWAPGVIQGGGFLFQVGIPSSNANHIHWALMTIAQAQALIQSTNPSVAVADPTQPSVTITTSANGNLVSHTHDITIFFDYILHTFVVTDITNITGPGGFDVPHAGFLVGGPPITIPPVPYDLTLACSDTTTAVAVKTNAALAIAPRNFTLTQIRGDLLTSSSSGTVTAQVFVNGTIIQTLNITATSTSVVQANTTSVNDGDRITVNITSAGTGAVALLVTLQGAA